MALTSEDDAVLASMGRTFLHNFAMACSRLTLYGIYLSLFPYSVIILCRKPYKTRTTYFLLTLICALFVASTSVVVGGIVILVLEFQQFLISPLLPLQSRKAAFQARYAPVFRCTLVGANLTFIIADAIVMWRAWVLYSHNKITRCVMVALVLANTVMFVYYSASYSVNINAPINVSLNAASTYLSAVTNLLATLMIALRVWNHRRETRFLKNFLGRDKSTQAERILNLLVETGLSFGLLQLVNAIITQFPVSTGSAQDFAQSAISTITTFSAAIFPTLIVIIVSRGNTSVIDTALIMETETTGTTTLNSTRRTSTLKFASRSTAETEIVEEGLNVEESDDIELKQRNEGGNQPNMTL